MVKHVELEPCPICKSVNLTMKVNQSMGGMSFIVCECCGLVASFHENEQKHDTIREWNNRTDRSLGTVQ